MILMTLAGGTWQLGWYTCGALRKQFTKPVHFIWSLVHTGRGGMGAGPKMWAVRHNVPSLPTGDQKILKA